MYVSITHFKVKSLWALPLFQWHAFTSYGQANRSLGIISSEAWPEKGRVFCTLTLWESKEDMLKFRNSGAHLKAMKISRKLGEGITHGWETDELPDKNEALARLFVYHEITDLAA